ncbi:hypothetical protein QAD02_016594 [Eretmocerus hayati]|uniref:Uncharacterized protein n=1 Tax=Eretmocerus hayati TaxID=131215 RepID=A0ACC2PBI9_9HYME|nr:hypothetical protein QAD02_016594 [Eretmocerus hayati]
MNVTLQEKRYVWTINFDEEEKQYESPEFWVFQYKWKLILRPKKSPLMKPKYDFILTLKYLGEDEIERLVELQIITHHSKNSAEPYGQENYMFAPCLAGKRTFNQTTNCLKTLFSDEFSESEAFGQISKIEILCKIRDEKPYSIRDHHLDVALNQQDILIGNEYEKLFENGKFSDVTIIMGNEKLPLHKNILSARSTYFSAMFDHDVRENVSNVVEIEDFSYEVMKEFFRYIYVGKLKDGEKYMTELLQVSDMYGMEGLKSLCEKSIAKTIQNHNALECLNLANHHNATWLKTQCMEYIVRNAREIVKLSEYKLNDLPELTKEFIVALANGISIT